MRVFTECVTCFSLFARKKLKSIMYESKIVNSTKVSLAYTFRKRFLLDKVIQLFTVTVGLTRPHGEDGSVTDNICWFSMSATLRKRSRKNDNS